MGMRLKLYLLAGLAFVAGLFGIHLSGVRRGRQLEQGERADDRLEAVREAKEVEDEIRSLDDEALARRASEYVRGKR